MTHITAKDLTAWASGNREAQGDLPILVRRLVHTTTSDASKIDFPGGDSIGTPGSDGVVIIGKGNAWVPDGESLWEVSCRADCKTKAKEDCQKWDDNKISAEERAKKSFVFVTPYIWPQRDKKGEWEKEMQEQHGWRNVRVLDANDLEQWVDTSTSVQAWMARKLSISVSFPGVVTLEEEWERWASVTQPEMSFDSAVVGQQNALANLMEWLNKPPSGHFRVFAESREQASAFVCAGLKKHREYADRLLVVWDNQTDARMLLNAEKMPQPIILFVEESKYASILERKAHVIIADVQGGQRDNGGKGGRLRRISQDEFVKSVIDMGFSEKEANKLNRESGRSITVLRRRLASRDSIVRPKWAKNENAKTMIAAALVGQWDENSEFDRDFISQLAGTSYKEFESQINEFRRLDDAPIEKIGNVWIVKSRIDSLLGVAESIVSSDLQMFWKKMECVLTIRNPAVDLSNEEKMLAAVRGQVPPYSRTLFPAVTDTLVLLSVYQEQITACENVGESVEALIQKVLKNAKSDRWYSLSGLLPKLAEAAPDVFLSALEKDLRDENPSVSSLFSPDFDWMFSKYDHTGLLWALEILAWNKRFLPRVIDALAKMNFALPGNLANRPSNTLLSFFRPWFPQCGMQVDERIEQFRRLSEAHPEITWHLSQTMVQGHDTAMDNALPRWSGVPEFAARKVTNCEYWQMKRAAFDIMMNLVSGRIERIIAVLEIFESLSSKQIAQFADVVATWGTTAGDEEKAEARAKIINNLYLCRLRIADESKKYYDFRIQVFEELREKLAPESLILRHKWLFENSWVELPDYPQVEGRDEERLQKRKEAVLEIYESKKTEGVFQLAACCGDSACVGEAAAGILKNNDDRMQWVSMIAKWDAGIDRKFRFMRGFLFGIPESESIALLGFKRAEQEQWEDDMILSFAAALWPSKNVWDVISNHCPQHVRSKYWTHGWVRPMSKEELPYYVSETMRIDRPDRALNWAVTYDFYGIQPERAADILEALLNLPNEQRINMLSGGGASWHIAQTMGYIARSGAVSEGRIVGLEISLYEVIRHSQYKPKTLFRHIATDPEFFMFLVCNLYKRADGEPDEFSSIPDEQKQATAGKSWDILTAWNVPPGCVDADNFDERQFSTWVEKTRELACKMNRLKVADETIGKVLKHMPKEGDLPFPDKMLQWLQDKGTDEMLSGLESATFNSRGVYVKAYAEGGEQERKLADKYRHIADTLRRYPRVADVFHQLADSYEYQGKREDKRAKLDDRRWD